VNCENHRNQSVFSKWGFSSDPSQDLPSGEESRQVCSVALILTAAVAVWERSVVRGGRRGAVRSEQVWDGSKRHRCFPEEQTRRSP